MWVAETERPFFRDQPISQLLIKVAARCNIDCSYCYWFRDAAVYNKPKVMSTDVLDQLLRRVEEHIVRYSFAEFPLSLHGGEPLLWGVENFHRIAEACEAISTRTRCKIPIAVTSNGILIDESWLQCFETHDIAVAVSLDGPAYIHDIHRRTFQGTGTHAAAEHAVRTLLARNINASVLAVCNPAHSPKQYFDFFAARRIPHYDIMIPDATVDENPPRLGSFYKDLFDLWLEANQHQLTVSIRIISNMVRSLLSNDASIDSIGYKPMELCTVMTDGSVEAYDVLRIAGDGVTQTSFNIFNHAIDDVRSEPQWKEAREASVNLCEKCRQCKFMNACGGGYLPHRFSARNGYNNPSVYCADLFATFEHIVSELEKRVYIVTG